MKYTIWKERLSKYVIAHISDWGGRGTEAERIVQSPGSTWICVGETILPLKDFYGDHQDQEPHHALGQNALKPCEDVIEAFIRDSCLAPLDQVELVTLEWDGAQKYRPARCSNEVVFNSSTFLRVQFLNCRIRELFRDSVATPFCCLGRAQQKDTDLDPFSNVCFVIMEIFDGDAFVVYLKGEPAASKKYA